MAALKNNGDELARFERSVTENGETTTVTFSVRSNGKILKKLKVTRPKVNSWDRPTNIPWKQGMKIKPGTSTEAIIAYFEKRGYTRVTA